jgi:hypothetical protein
MVAAATLALEFGSAQPVQASIGDPVDCTDSNNGANPHCDVTAENEPVYEDGGDGNVVCRQGGDVVPCVNDDGWLGSDGCRYLQLDDVAPPAGAETPGAAYRPTCPGDPAGSARAAVWLPDSETPGLVQLAQIAVSRLAPPAPQIELSPPPPAPQLVMLPMWLWVDEATWGPRSATASVPGVSVTATATPTRVVWLTGDGGTQACDGPGKPWQPGMDPRAESPACGHTYTGPSRNEPGGVYELRATVTWQVSWSGGGSSGTVGPLSTTSVTPVRVAESLARNTGGQP